MDIKERIGRAIIEIISCVLKECSICGKKVIEARVLYNFKKLEGDGSIYIRGSVVCRDCNDTKPEEVEKLKLGKNFNLGDIWQRR